MPQPIPGSTTQPTIPTAGSSANSALSALAKAAPRLIIVNNGPGTVFVRAYDNNSGTASLADVPIPQTTNNPYIFDKPIGWGFIAVFLPGGATNTGINVTGLDGFQ